MQSIAPTSRPGARRDVPIARRKPLVLVVEDHEFAREALAVFLSASGYDVIEAANGRDALQLLAAGARPDVILLDLMMPVMTGWEFLDEQRLDPDLRTIPIIVVTGVPSHDPRCLEMPLVRFLAKPYTADHVIAAIEAELTRITTTRPSTGSPYS